MNVDGRLSQANGRLKSAKIRVRIEAIGHRLYLRASLPKKSGEGSAQYRLATGQSTTIEGLKQAEIAARDLSIQIARGSFSWAEYDRASPPETVEEWIARFERDYFTRRQRNPKSETTWQGDYLAPFKRLPQDVPLTIEVMEQAITSIAADTRQRQRFSKAMDALAKFAGIEVSFSSLRGSYSPFTTSPRALPTDRTITFCREAIPNPEWQRVYGLIATYGLRPHEVFSCDLSAFPMLRVGDDTKTGSRLIYPLYPEWAENWNLQGDLPKVTGKNNQTLGNRVCHAFSRYNILFPPYNLRHAWAVRAISFRLPVELASQQQGHSVAVHTKIYHAWITEDFYKQVYDVMINRSDRPKPP